MFNRYKLIMDNDTLSIVQKGQGKRIEKVDVSNSGFKHSYMEQRARGAYIATICQPEAAYDLSITAQHQDPTPDDIKALNKHLEWQKANVSRGLTYIALDLPTAKLFVFVDGSFTNNHDLSS